MIFVGNIREVRRNEYDSTYAIVRKLSGKSDWIRQMPTLAPSKELLARHHALKNSGKWNQQTFQRVYVPAFLLEMHHEDARKALNNLFLRDRRGERIALVCYCSDETICHRSIVAGLLQGAGCNVVTTSGADYRSFFQQYRAADLQGRQQP